MISLMTINTLVFFDGDVGFDLSFAVPLDNDWNSGCIMRHHKTALLAVHLLYLFPLSEPTQSHSKRPRPDCRHSPHSLFNANTVTQKT